MVRHITSEHYFHHPVSNTFHGRDIFAPVAAYLSKGVDTAKFGEEISDYVRFLAPKPKATSDKTWKGIVLKTDKFGNLVTNVTPKDIPQIFNNLFFVNDNGFPIVNFPSVTLLDQCLKILQ